MNVPGIGSCYNSSKEHMVMGAVTLTVCGVDSSRSVQFLFRNHHMSSFRKSVLHPSIINLPVPSRINNLTNLG